MWFKILANYINGYIKIEVEGYYIERFINTCMKNGIFLWGITRKKGSIIDAKIGIKDYDRALEISKEHSCLITIKNKKGVPFLIKRYKKRKIFFILLFLLFVLIISLSRFIWNVEVTGAENINGEEIIDIAKQNGLKVGTFKSGLNTEDIINKIRLSRDDIAWLGIEIKGTNAIIRVVEADEKPDIVDENSFSNIVASKDGVITSISAQNGTIMVEKGAEVKKGDVLIAGWMEGKYTGKYYVNSNGEVKAKIVYAKNTKIYKKETKKQETGNINKKYAIKFNNFKINFYKKLSKFEKYDTIVSSKKIELFSNFYLPIEFIKYTNYELNEIDVEHNKEEAITLGEKLDCEELDSLINGEVIDKQTDVTEYDRYYDVKVTYTVEESIGTKEKIEF